MIEFMVLAMPRSGTAWVANWLTTDRTLCLHDPLWKHHYDELDGIRSSGKRLGVACTGLALFPEFLASHRARKVILHRPLDEVNASLLKIGLEPLAPSWLGALERINGLHVDWRDVLNPAKAEGIYNFLTQRTFDAERHALLTEVNVQMAFERVRPDPRVTRRLFDELRRIGESLQ